MYGKNGGGAYSVVDDRRWIDVKGNELEVADIDPGAALGSPGRHLVRILYVSNTLASRAEHEITMTAADKVRVATSFAIETPSWSARDGAPVRARVVLYDGVPGGDHPPAEVARGDIPI